MEHVSPQSNSQHFDLNLLKVFETLFFEQNMTRTADILHITPSAVSHAVKRMRELLNDSLFTRQGHKMLPTPACRRLAPELIQTLSKLRKQLQQFGQFEPSSAAMNLKIAIPDALEPLFIPLIFARLANVSPKSTLTSVKVQRDKLNQQLSSGEADFVIDVALPLAAPIRHVPLISAPFCILVRKGHSLTTDLNEQVYIEGDHLAVSNRPAGRVIDDVVFNQKGVNRNVKMRCQNYQTAKKIIAQTDLILTLPESLAVSLDNKDLILLPMPLTVPETETHLYWHANTEEDEALRWYRDMLIDLIKMPRGD